MCTPIQIPIHVRMQRLDNVFHRMVVALERLEIFTEAVRLDGKANTDLTTTAIRTDRDMHDDASNPPTRDSFYGEVQLQLSALFFQTQIDNKEIFNPAVKYFLGDLLEWYGGRNDSIPYNGVDAFVLPIIRSLSQQAKDVAEVMEVVAKYVATIPGISTFSDDEKAEAIANAMEKLILITEHNREQSHQTDLHEDVKFTVHKRGDRLEGYKRLINAMLQMYDEAMPAIVVYRTINNFLPEITEAVPTITEENIVEFVTSKNSQDCNSREDFESNSNSTDTNHEHETDSATENGPEFEPVESSSNREENNSTEDSGSKSNLINTNDDPEADSAAVNEAAFESFNSAEISSDKEENVETEIPLSNVLNEEKVSKEPGFIEKVINLFK